MNELQVWGTGGGFLQTFAGTTPTGSKVSGCLDLRSIPSSSNEHKSRTNLLHRMPGSRLGWETVVTGPASVSRSVCCKKMTPKETVQSAFETAITPALEQEGFAYSRSQFAFKRKVDEFVQHISITLSHHGRAADLFLIGGLVESAVAALEAGLESLKKEEIPVSPNAHPTLVWKRRRQAEDRERRRLVFVQRIRDLRNSDGTVQVVSRSIQTALR